MTAAHRIETTPAPAVKGPRHAAPKADRKLHLPKVSRPTMPSLPKRPAKKTAKVESNVRSIRFTPAGQALYSVDREGVAHHNLLVAGVDGIRTFAQNTGETMVKQNETHWIVEMFETPEQRQARKNQQLVGIGLQLLGHAAAKLVR